MVKLDVLSQEDSMSHSEKLLSLTETSELVSLTRVSIWALAKAGKFPKPVRITGRRVGFVNSEIQAWIRARIDERDAMAAMPP